MYNIAICDDEKVFLEKISHRVRAFFDENGEGVIIDTFLGGGTLVDLVERRKFYNIYILDIDMPKYKGVDIARKIKELQPKAIVMFVTAYMEFAVEGYELSIFRYIPKHLLEERLQKALTDALGMMKMQEGKSYVISNSRRFERIFYDEIYYIYKKQKNVVFVTENREEKYVRKTLAEVYRELDSEEFVYIDCCYIINILKIKNIDNSRVYLANGMCFCINSEHLSEVRKSVNLFWGKWI